MPKTKVTTPVPMFPSPGDEQPEATFIDVQNEMDRRQWRGVSSRIQLPGSNGLQHEGDEDQGNLPMGWPY